MINDPDFPTLASTGAPVGSYYGASGDKVDAPNPDDPFAAPSRTVDPVPVAVESVTVMEAVQDPKMRKAHGAIFAAGTAFGVVAASIWRAVRGGMVIGGRSGRRARRR